MEQNQEPLGTFSVTSQIPGGLARTDFFAGATETMVAREVQERVALSKLWGSDAIHSFKRLV